MDDVQPLTEREEFFIRTWWLMDLSIEVMWKYLGKNNTSKKQLKDKWDRMKAHGWKQNEIHKRDPNTWDIVVMHEAITNERLKLVEKDSLVKRALNGLVRIRNDCIGHVSRGVDRVTFEKAVEDAQGYYKTLIGSDEQARIDGIKEPFADQEAIKLWRKKLEDMEDQLDNCLQNLHGQIWLKNYGEREEQKTKEMAEEIARLNENWEEQKAKGMAEDLATLNVIKQLTKDTPITPEIVPGIFEVLPHIIGVLFHPPVCKKWEVFGEYFGVTSEILSQMKQRQPRPGLVRTHEEFLMLLVVEFLLHRKQKLIFSKEHIYQALIACNPVCAKEFKDIFYRPDEK